MHNLNRTPCVLIGLFFITEFKHLDIFSLHKFAIIENNNGRAGFIIIANIISLIILFIGGLNWGLVGIFNFNLVDWVFGGYNAGSIIIYILVLLATMWLSFVVLTRQAIYVRNIQK